MRDDGAPGIAPGGEKAGMYGAIVAGGCRVGTFRLVGELGKERKLVIVGFDLGTQRIVVIVGGEWCIFGRSGGEVRDCVSD